MTEKYVFNPFTGTLDKIDVAAAAEVGGLYGINVETLTGSKTLTPNTDKIYQYLNPNGTNRDITLDTASATAGDRFIIRAVGTYSHNIRLAIKQAAATIDYLYPSAVGSYIFDGTNWVSGQFPSGEAGSLKYNVLMGAEATGYRAGAAVGFQANANFYGAALGCYSQASNYAAALGYYADGVSYGVALGYYADTNTRRYSNAIGYRSKCERTGETAINIGDQSDQENNMMIAGWERQTTNDTPTELYAGGRTNYYFTIRAKSSLTFRIMVTARDNTTGDCAAYIFDGLIKRDAANNTVMSICNKTVIHEDDASWDCNVTANDVNETLKIEVTGDADNVVQWAARLDGVETHF